MKLSDFYYELPDQLIARYPTEQRTHSRLMVVNPPSTELRHWLFYQIRALFQPGDLLILNHTKVIPARLFAHKPTGGKVELLLERVLNETSFLAQMKASKPCRVGDSIYLANGERLHIQHKSERFYELTRQSRVPIMEWFQALGDIPLPPYMQRAAEPLDYERYQTVYAKETGSVAAPTAGFHFDQELLQALQADGVQLGYVNLQVGAGTFLPVRVDDIERHTMHSEYYVIDDHLAAQVQNAKATGKRVIAVGTTSLRALESAALSTGQVEPKSEETAIFIYPGFKFNVVDVLITNFHLPESTLLMLVSAFIGHECMRYAYQEAIQQHYRFFSYGDAMWLSALPK